VEVFKASAAQQKPILQYLADHAKKGSGSPAFAILLTLIGAAQPGVAASLSLVLLDVYRDAIQPDSDVWNVELVSPASARVLVEAIHAATGGQALLEKPVDIAAALAGAGDEQTKQSVAHDLAQAVRAHIRLLARALSAYESKPPSYLTEALSSAIRMGAFERFDSAQVAAFSAFTDSVHYWGRRQRSIALELANAIEASPAAAQEDLIRALIEVDQPGVLAELYRRLPGSLRAPILQRVEELTPDVAGDVVMLPDLQQLIRQLLAAGMAGTAERFIAYEKGLNTGGKLPARAVEQFRAGLHLHLLREEFDQILAAKPPEGLRPEDTASAQETLDFYRGIVMIQSPVHRNPAGAAAAFYQLYTRHRVPSYAINLLAARVAKLLPTNTFDQLEGDNADLARNALSEAATALPEGSLEGDDDALHRANVATLQLALGKTSEARATLKHIEGPYLSPMAVALEAVAMARQGRQQEGIHLLRDAELRMGGDPAFDGARDYISRRADYVARAQAIGTQDSVESWRNAFQKFKERPAFLQAQLHAGQSGTPALEECMTMVIRESLASVASLSSRFKLHEESRHHEDAINTLVREFLTTHFARWYGWNVADKSLGGFTPNGNPGERDVVIKQWTGELAIYEGLKYSRASMQKHLKKVTAYSQCDLFFHVSYYYDKEPAKALKVAEEVALAPPPGLTFKSKAALARESSLPEGIVVRYENAAAASVTVVFLIVDLAQFAQRLVVGAPGTSAPAANPQPAAGPGAQTVASSPASTSP
jgi:hypothetical protein